MALVLKDRISETTTTTGTGTITLGGATPGFQPFSSIGDTNTTYYCVTSGAAWEVGIGTYASSGNTLARTTILANSNNNTSPITLGAGTKVVFSVYPADRAVVVDGTTIQIPNNAVLPVANGGTGSNTAAFSGANITDLNATAITAGTIANNRTTASSSNGASTIVQRDASGDFSANIITANSYSGSGASLTSLNASSISSGTLGVANGGTGSSTATFSGANITSLNASNISAGTIGNSYTTAASANGASTIVARDATGNFSANTITATLSGNATNVSGTVAVGNGGTGQTSLTANNVILGNGTSAVQFVAPGTSANVLTSNGTTWISQAPAAGGGGSYVYLSSATASNSVVDFTGLNTSTYNSFIINFTDVRSAGGMFVRLYLNGTLTTTAIYNWTTYQINFTSGGGANYSAAQSSFSIGSAVTTANMGNSGTLQLFPAGGYSAIIYQLCFTGSAGSSNDFTASGGGTCSSTTAANGIRFFGTAAGGNLTGGNFWIYGVKSS